MYGAGTERSPIEVDSDGADFDIPKIHSSKKTISKKPHKNNENRSKIPTSRCPGLLLHLPLEILHLITHNSTLSNVDRHSLKLTTRCLRTAGIDTTPLTKSEFRLFNKQLEASLPLVPPPHHTLLSATLLCQMCLTFRPKTSFPDAHARPSCPHRARTCLPCSVAGGHFDRRRFRLGQQKHFLCAACGECKPVTDEETAELDTGTELKLWQRFGTLRGVEVRVRVGKRRWCRACWKGVEGFWRYAGEEGRMREVFGRLEGEDDEE